MADKAMDLYLNDHLAGATLGTDLAQHIKERHAGTPLGDAMKTIADEVEEDRRTLLDLMERMGTQPNPVKQAVGWLTEKASRVKFSGVFSGEQDHGAFMALESLTLGVEGKAHLWKALKEVADEYPSLATTKLDELIERAETQKATLESLRLAAGRKALHRDPEPERVNPYSEDRPPSSDDRWAAGVS
jgi:hypothetical protein